MNKQVEIDNQEPATIVAKRLICDHICVIGGILNIDICNKQLIVACANARHKYFVYLKEQKKTKADNEKAQMKRSG